MLTISVKNFGPIAEGSVDLKPLTIFVGPSNTGKSYMATAVYAVMRAFEETDQASYRRYIGPEGEDKRLYWRADSGRTVTARNGGANAANAVLEWAASLPEEARDGREISVSDLSGDLRAELEDSVRILLGSINGDVIDMIEQNYGLTADTVESKVNPDDSCIVFHRGEPLLSTVVPLYSTKQPTQEFDLSLATLRQPFLQGLFDDKPSEVLDHHAALTFLMMVDYASDSLFVGLPQQSYYLPASRSGMVQTYKVISASLIRRSSLFGRQTRGKGSIALPGIITDFLGDLIDLDQRIRRQQRNSDLENVISFIENKVLQGKIDLDKSVWLPYPEIAYETGAGKFSLDQSSSMVSELAPLVLFLKYLVRPGDLLVLEEPESHLHPAAQLQLARGIARLVNAGVQVLITTHSGDFMGQIDNLLRMSNSSEKSARSLGLEQEDCLSPEQVSAYGFRFDSSLGGAVTYPLPVGSDVGIEDEEFLPVAELLYHQALDLEDARLT